MAEFRRFVAGVILVSTLAGCSGKSHLPRPRVSVDDDEPAPTAPTTRAVASPPPAASQPNEPVSPATATVVPASNSSDAAKELRPEVSGLPEPELRKRVFGQMTRINQAFESYRKKNETYPFRRFGPQGGLSWRVVLLPYLGCSDLYLKFNLAENWDSSHNLALLKEIPDVFKAAERTDGKTHILCVRGPDTAYASDDGLTSESCSDGLDNTIILVEVGSAHATPWTAPNDYVLNRESLQADLFSMRQDCCLVMLGGATGPRRLEANVADDRLLALFTPNGGEQVALNDASSYPHPTVDMKLIEELKVNPIVRFAKLKNAATEKQKAVATAGSPTPAAGTNSKAGSQANVAKSKLETPVEPLEDTRLPVPADDVLAKTAELIRDVYGAEFKAAKNVTQRREFCKKMLDQSRTMSEDPAGSFVLCRAARDAAAVAGDVDLAFRAADQLAASYKVDALEMKSAILQVAGAGLQNHAEAEMFITCALEIGDLYLAKDDFEAAKRTYGLAMTSAKRANKQDLAVRVTQRTDKLDDARHAYNRVSNDLHKVLRDPNDPQANVAVGRYLALVKNEWPRGLDMLSRGNDETLRELAELELTATTAANDQVKIADGWWDWSGKSNNELEKNGARHRAIHWYRLAVPNLPASLIKSRAEKRMAELPQDGESPGRLSSR